MRPLGPWPALLLLAVVLLAGCSQSAKDGDDDGMYDDTESDGWSVTVDSLTERTRRHVSSDPGMADTDGDGVPDNEEFFLGTDPRASDTDGDGLTDCQEVRHTVQADCEDPEFHGPFDGGHGTEPTSADSDPGVSVYVLQQPFTDHTGSLGNGYPSTGDGIADGEEVAGYTIDLSNGNSRFVRTAPRDADTDGDLLDDGEERYTYRSDPTVRDTDGDGCEDGLDPVPSREESYIAGLGNFTLLASGSAEVRLNIVLANVDVRVPASGAISVRQGETQDFSPHTPAALRPDAADGCHITARHPWARFQVAAEADGRVLDIGSATGGSAIATVWWNIQDGRLSLTDAGAPVAGPRFVSEGPDGRLELVPGVRFA